MIDSATLQKYLPNLWQQAQAYDIPVEFLQDHTKLIELVLTSRAIDSEEEKQNWFNLLPLMTGAQIQKLYEILERERAKIQEIEKKYEEKKNEIKMKYLAKWQQLGYVNKMGEITEKEKAKREQEEAEAEDLLKNL